MRMPEYYVTVSDQSWVRARQKVSHISIHYIFVAIVVHLVMSPVKVISAWVTGGRELTSCERVEFPHPSIKILDDLSGMSSRMMSAMSL